MTMTLKRFVAPLSILPLVFLVAGCHGEPNERAADPPGAAEASASGGEATAESPASDVTYEPAYPTDVSEEGLSQEDTAQQQATHSHGGEEHSHGEGDEHSHGEGEHTHGDGGQDDHQH